jgi:hypothetical protein
MSSRPSAMCALTSARSFVISAVRIPCVARFLFPIGAPRRDREIFFFLTFNSSDLPLTASMYSDIVLDKFSSVATPARLRASSRLCSATTSGSLRIILLDVRMVLPPRQTFFLYRNIKKSGKSLPIRYAGKVPESKYFQPQYSSLLHSMKSMLDISSQ